MNRFIACFRTNKAAIGIDNDGSGKIIVAFAFCDNKDVFNKESAKTRVNARLDYYHNNHYGKPSKYVHVIDVSNIPNFTVKMAVEAFDDAIQFGTMKYRESLANVDSNRPAICRATAIKDRFFTSLKNIKNGVLEKV